MEHLPTVLGFVALIMAFAGGLGAAVAARRPRAPTPDPEPARAHTAESAAETARVAAARAKREASSDELADVARIDDADERRRRLAELGRRR